LRKYHENYKKESLGYLEGEESPEKIDDYGEFVEKVYCKNSNALISAEKQKFRDNNILHPKKRSKFVSDDGFYVKNIPKIHGKKVNQL